MSRIKSREEGHGDAIGWERYEATSPSDPLDREDLDALIDPAARPLLGELDGRWYFSQAQQRFVRSQRHNKSDGGRRRQSAPTFADYLESIPLPPIVQARRMIERLPTESQP